MRITRGRRATVALSLLALTVPFAARADGAPAGAGVTYRLAPWSLNCRTTDGVHWRLTAVTGARASAHIPGVHLVVDAVAQSWVDGRFQDYQDDRIVSTQGRVGAHRLAAGYPFLFEGTHNPIHTRLARTFGRPAGVGPFRIVLHGSVYGPRGTLFKRLTASLPGCPL